FRVYEPQLGLTGARTAYFHKTLGGYHGAKPRRFEELYQYYNTHQIEGVLDILNVKYILFPEEQSGELKPMRNPNALGSAWFVDKLVSNPTADALLARLKTMDFRNEALFIEGDLPSTLPQKFDKDSISSIVLKMSKPNKLVYSTESLNDQFAVFSEMYYPKGWIAKVNGKETSIYSVNYILRGIEVPAGKNTIEFSFNPPVVSKGTKLRWMSAFLFLGIVIGIGYLQYRTKKST
ncbi:YfhO family protein, partial [Flavobacteriaceae bacterium]|nr:YfhO family protein [Flavobacteriaceae bacterium]